jgi:hypothetical protein
MRRLADDTKGRYYEARTARGIERSLQAIESRLRCDLKADDYVGEIGEPPGEDGEDEDVDEEDFEDEGDVDGDGEDEGVYEPEEFETELDDDAHTADMNLTWRSRKAGFEVQRIDVVRRGRVVRRVGAAGIQRAYAASGSSAAVTGGRGRRFRSLHVRGLSEGGRLRVLVRRQQGRQGGRVFARVTQSRLRR